jgi:hypothetical protein
MSAHPTIRSCASFSTAALAHASGRPRTILRCGCRFLRNSAAPARQHRPASLVAGREPGKSLSIHLQCCSRQHSWGIHHLVCRPKRRRGSTAPLCAGTPSRAYHWMGGASSCPSRLSSRHASSAYTALAFCTRIRRAGSIAAAFSHCV